MKSLLLLRHAKSSWSNPNVADHDRPLNARGKQDAPRMGRLLRQLDLVPDLIISSTAKRAVSTAEAVAVESGYENEIELARHLYHAWPGTFVEALRAVDEAYQRVMIVGHNPGLEELVEELTGLTERMPTGALARITLPVQRWLELDEETAGELVGLWTPRATR
jgi:phosphohistidine phosphatase